MKVILIKDFGKLGVVGDIVKVKDGYANNFLIPNGVAINVTKGNIKQMELVKKSIIKKEAKNVAEAENVADALKDLEISFKVKTSPEGKLYGSITNKDIAEEIYKERKVEIDKKKIELIEHIKEPGEYNMEIKLYKDVKYNLKVKVVSDEPVEDKEESKKEEIAEKETKEE